MNLFTFFCSYARLTARLEAISDQAMTSQPAYTDSMGYNKGRAKDYPALINSFIKRFHRLRARGRRRDQT